MGGTITWLHISDLHAGKPGTGWDARRVTEALVADLEGLERDHGLRPDLLFFTGDAAFGQVGPGPGETLAEQFDLAHGFLTAVRQAYDPEIPQENVFLVPGNHDLDRSAVGEDQVLWLEQQDDPWQINDLVKTAGPQWQRIVERQAAYRRFLEAHGYAHLLDDPGRLVYAITREVNGVAVGVGGLNSTWSCCRDGEKGRLWVGGHWQLEYLYGKLGKADLTVALMHHPTGWLNEHEAPAFGRGLERDFHVVLHGHEHDAWVRAGADSHTYITAGACYERSGKRNGYNLVRLDLEKGAGEAWLRTYDASGGGWIPCLICGKTDDRGVWPLFYLASTPATSFDAGPFQSGPPAGGRGAGAPSWKPDEIRARYALLIGVRDYVHPAYPPLPHTVHDVVALGELLSAAGYTVRTLHSGQSDPALEPTRSNVWESLENVAGQTGPGDLLLVYFGGHGDLGGDGAYLVPSDGGKSSLGRTAVDLDEFKDALAAAGAQARVLLLDACHSGVGRAAAGMEAEFERHVYLEATGVAVLASCRQGEVAHEHDASSHGAFTYFALEGLRGEARRGDCRFVSFGMLNDHVTGAVKRWAIGRGLRQWPNASTSLAGDPPLVELERVAGAAPVARPADTPSEDRRLIRKYLRHTYHVNGVALTADDRFLASCSGDCKTLVWQVTTGEIVAMLKHDKWVGAVNFSPDGQLLATSDGNGVIRLWDFRKEELVATCTAHQGACRTIAFSTDGRFVASGGGDARIQFCSVPDLEPAFALEAHGGEVRRLAFSPDGEHLVSGGEDGQLFLWRLVDRTCQLLLESKHNLIRSVAYVRTGEAIAATDSDGVVWLWDTANQVCRWRIQGHTGPAVGVAFHPGGEMVATGGQDKMIRLWDAGTGRLLDTIPGHEDTVTCLAFAGDGRWLVSGSRDKSLCLWQV